MSGHSKWSKIKRQKALSDVNRGKLFSKLSRSITLAVQQGGGLTEPQNNIKLRLAIDKARHLNMPKENIDRAIAKGTQSTSRLSEVIYEGFSREGAAVIIVCQTDNPSRSVAQIRNILDLHQAKLSSFGSLSYLFQRCAVITFDKTVSSEEKVMDFADKTKAYDIDQDQEAYTVYFPYESLGHYKDVLNGLTGVAEDDFRPKTTVSLEKDRQENFLRLINDLEEADDVSEVFHNANLVDNP